MGIQIASHIPVDNGFPVHAVLRGASRPVVAAVQTCASGSIVFAEGDDADCVFEILSGTLRLYKTLLDGRRQIIGFVSGGKLLGLATQDQYLCTAEAITPLSVRRHRRPAFERRIDEEPGLARRLLVAMSQELRMAQDQMLLLGRKSAVEKVASFLMTLASQEDGEYAEHIALPMGRSDIADYLGLTVETVSRTFTKLKNDGLIALPTPSSVEVLDPDQLEDLAAGAAEEDGWTRKTGRA